MIYSKMPINYIQDMVVDRLNSISYEKPNSDFIYSPRNGFKSCILNGNGVDVSVLDSKRFSVSIQPDRYYEAITSDFYYSYQKADRQKIAIDALISEKKCPLAWLLVTAYYSAFYSAIEISRLSGYHNLSLSNDHINNLNSSSETAIQLDGAGVYISEGVELVQDNYFIRIVFSRVQTKPHNAAWTNLLGRMNKGEIGDVSSPVRRQRIKFLKEIINADNQSWHMPSRVRNDWNYSFLDSYSPTYDNKAKELRYLLEGDDFKRLTGWADKKKSSIDESDYATSIGYVSGILNHVLDNLKGRIIS